MTNFEFRMRNAEVGMWNAEVGMRNAELRNAIILMQLKKDGA